MKKLFIGFIPLLFLFLGCSDNKKEDPQETLIYADKPAFSKKIYTFGVHPLHNPQKLFEVYQPLVDLINENLENASLKLEASRNYKSYDKKLFSGYFDISLPNPYQTIIAADKGYTIFAKMGDDKNFRGIIITRKDSNITDMKDLVGKTLSFPAKTALAATIMPQYFMYLNGVNVTQDVVNSYVGSQESSIMNVFLKKSFAGSTWPPPWIIFQKDRPEIAKHLEVKWETKPLINNGFVARNDFPKEVLNTISKVLFNLHTHAKGKQILEGMNLSKYEKADYQTYDVVRNFLKTFEKDVKKVNN